MSKSEKHKKKSKKTVEEPVQNEQTIEDKQCISTEINKSEKHKKKSKKTEVEEPVQNKKTTEETCEESKKGVTFSSDVIDNEILPDVPPKNKKRKKTDMTEETRLPTTEEMTECDKPENKKNVHSKRARKREKYERLKVEQKLKSEVAMQEKALNYLSKWKHSRNDWKFEKLRQVWLQNHMFDSAAIPDEFWDNMVEYFGGSKGKIREILIESCKKIVDENTTEDSKYTRARTLLQFLQE